MDEGFVIKKAKTSEKLNYQLYDNYFILNIIQLVNMFAFFDFFQ